MKNAVFLSQKAFVFNSENKFLTLLLTESAPTRPLLWDLPGGVFEAGEDPLESVRREIREEAGFEVSELYPITVHGEYSDKKEFVVTIAYRAKTDGSAVRLSFEHKEYRWVSLEEFLELESSPKWRSIADTYLHS